MEFIIVVAILVVAILAVRFGHDSRESVRSKEHELARHGVSWVDCTADSADPRTPAETPVHSPTRAGIDRADPMPPLRVAVMREAGRQYARVTGQGAQLREAATRDE